MYIISAALSFCADGHVTLYRFFIQAFYTISKEATIESLSYCPKNKYFQDLGNLESTV